jgi:hypothetical protein
VGGDGGPVEVEWGRGTPVTADALASPYSENLPRETDEQIEGRSDFQGEEDLTEGAAEDEWGDLMAGSSNPEDVGVNAVQAGPPHNYPRRAPGPGLPTAAGGRWTKRKQESNADQQWEEARQRARQREVMSSGFSSEDEDEEQQGEWKLELFEPP